ncbi:MAG: cupin [Gammaproteobacteria bacterium]|nr:cupin [Gammaproteobacteria bacterium]
MSKSDFASRLTRDGYGEFSTGQYEPHHAQADHTHDFDLQVLITAGEITVTSLGVEKTYRTGDAVEVRTGQVHREAVGPHG